jgi:hypothetical protein
MQPATRKPRGEHGRNWKTKAELLLIVAEAGGRCAPEHVRERAVALGLVSASWSSAIRTQRRWLIEHGYLTTQIDPQTRTTLWALPGRYSDAERIYEQMEKYLPEKLDLFLQSMYVSQMYARDVADELARHRSAEAESPLRTKLPRITEAIHTRILPKLKDLPWYKEYMANRGD